MSIKTCLARVLCVFVTAAVASAPDPARAGEAGKGLLLDRLSKRYFRTWSAIEKVLAASGPAGEPRSPTLRRLWEWARTSTHALRVEMVSRSKIPTGHVGVFRVEHVDPSGLTHVAVIRICPRNIQVARVRPAPDATLPFVRFEGLTDVERYAEVLAHELAHAEYVLDNPERLAQVVAAQRAIDAFLSGPEPRVERPHLVVAQRLPEPLAVLAAAEAYAESVEAVVLRELTASRPSQTAMGGFHSQ
jgi:hypothetical protein